MMKRLVATFSFTLFLAILSPQAIAQATRTWVSGVGDDANPCSRTAPCKTFAGAISKTAAGGEISTLDPGGFGGFTITKSITINGDGNLASILVAGTNGINVNAGSTDVVVLRNLSLHGVGQGLNGVRFTAGALLVVEHCTITGFTQNDIEVALSGAGNLSVSHTSMTGGMAGVKLTSGTVNASLNHVAIKGTTNGISTLVGVTDISNSVIAQNSAYGVLADGGSVITLEGNMLTGNGTAAQAQTGSTLRLSNNDVFDNSIGFGCGGGTLASANNNRKGGNMGGGTACSPTVPITVQ